MKKRHIMKKNYQLSAKHQQSTRQRLWPHLL